MLRQFSNILRVIQRSPVILTKRTMGTEESYKTLLVETPKPFVYHVQFNRPEKLNAFNNQMWMDIKNCFDSLGNNPDCRVIVLSANGKHFSAGIDLKDLMKLGQEMGEIEDAGRKGHHLGKKIKQYQDSISSLEDCAKPVIAVIHSACVGAGINLITAADIRYCSTDAWFQVKEVGIGMAADVGILQRLPKVMGNQSICRELCFTARKFSCKEALNYGLVSKVMETKEEILQEALKLAEDISTKSPIAVQATKKNMVYSLDHTNQEGLDQIREMNKLLLQSEDLLTAAMAQLTKGDPPVFSKL